MPSPGVGTWHLQQGSEVAEPRRQAEAHLPGQGVVLLLSVALPEPFRKWRSPSGAHNGGAQAFSNPVLELAVMQAELLPPSVFDLIGRGLRP